MLKELIVNEDTDISSIEESRGIVLGNEGCIYRIIGNDILEVAKEACVKGLAVRLITPFVPNNCMDSIYNQIKRLSKECNLKVTFNDYGLLHRCKGLIESGEITPVAGRILTRSIIDCPWYDKLLVHEPEALQDAIIGSNYFHSSKWKILKKYGINELEINTIPKKYIDELKQSKFKITYHADNNIISVGRVCFTARWYELNIHECRQFSKCRTKITIGLEEKWSKRIRIYEEKDDPIKEYFEGMYLQGNVVYQQLDRNHEKLQADIILI